MDIRREDFPEEYLELVDRIGTEAMSEFLKMYGGRFLYIRKYDSVTRKARNREIRENFTGDYATLALRYNLSENMIREIVAEGRKKPRQGELF